MITENYVNKEIALLLRKKGFDEPTLYHYNGDNKEPNHTIDYDLIKNSEAKEFCSAPTLQMSMKWLREIHDLHICIFIGEDYSTDADGNTVDKWQFWTYNITNIYGDMVYDAYDKFDCTEYQSYEEACEAAIKYCLTKLI